MSAPYCSVEGCHDTRTNSYAVGGTTTGGGYPTQRTVMAWFGDAPYGDQLCRIHALQRYRWAIGGRP